MPDPIQDLPPLLAELKAQHSENRLKALHRLIELPILSPETLVVIEELALQDPDSAVRQAALEALGSRAAAASRRAAPLPRSVRLDILIGIDRWLVGGLISRDQAEVLRRRYNYDISPVRLSNAGRAALDSQVSEWLRSGLVTFDQAAALRGSLQPSMVPAAKPAGQPVQQLSLAQAGPAQVPEAAPHVPGERGNFWQVLFSETSIRIALYLGGFLIVAAALILAALVEVARLPILLGLTIAAATASAAMRRGLPLPAFVIFTIFACFIPIDARIWIDQLHGSSVEISGWWSLAWLATALALAAGVRLYTSRFFSVMALGALLFSAWMLSERILEQGDTGYWRISLLLLALLVGLGGVGLLRLWKGFTLARPLFWTAQIAGWLAFFVLSVITFVEALSELSEMGEWPLLGCTWLLALAFYLLSDRWLHPLLVFPYQAVIAITGAAWAFLLALDSPFPWFALILAGLGVLYSLAAHFLDRRGAGMKLPRHYNAAFWLAGFFVLAWSVVAGSGDQPWRTDLPPGLQNNWPAFGILLFVVLLYTTLHARLPRWWVWFSALLAAFFAYLVFFSLPFAANWDVPAHYLLLLAGALYLVPDLAASGDLSLWRAWRWLPRAFGVVLLSIDALLIVIGHWVTGFSWDVAHSLFVPRLPWGEYALVYAIIGVFCLAYALRFRLPWLVYGLAGNLGLAIVYLMKYLDRPTWALPLARLAMIFYLIGFALRDRVDSRWSGVLRWSGLALGSALLLRLPFEAGAQPGVALLLAGGFFLAERLFTHQAWLEWPTDVLLSASFVRLLDWAVPAADLPAWGLLLVALTVLGFDLIFTRLISDASGPRLPARLVGGLVVFASAVYLLVSTQVPAAETTAIFWIYAVFFLLSAVVYRTAWVGYFCTAALALGLFYFVRVLEVENWLAPQVALAVAFYAGGLLLARIRAHASWAAVLRLSGLGLGLLASTGAPLLSGLTASLPVAAAATLYAVEAFRVRNVWLGFPANGLYLLAYFIILFELNVDQPQYYSLAVAALGLLMHFLLVRSGSARGAALGAVITGMVSQLVLLGTTYIQMYSTNQLSYFIMLFFQGLVVLGYGILIRSRSLVITPLIFIVLGVITVVLSVLSGVPTAIIIGCTGLVLLVAGILAVVMRERILAAGDRLGGWRA